MKEESKKCILIIEDNDAHAEIVKRGIKKCLATGEIKRASNGEEAINYLFRKDAFEKDPNWVPPGLILLDLRLPRVGGLEVLKQVKSHEELHRTPVVVLTSSQAESDISEAYRCNVNSYLVKPLDYVDFSKLLKDLVTYWMERNVLD